MKAEFNLLKIDYVFSEVIKRAHAEAREHIKLYEKLPKEAVKQFQALELNFNRYNELKKYFGTEKDMERLDIGQNVLPSYGCLQRHFVKIAVKKPEDILN